MAHSQINVLKYGSEMKTIIGGRDSVQELKTKWHMAPTYSEIKIIGNATASNIVIDLNSKQSSQKYTDNVS